MLKGIIVIFTIFNIPLNKDNQFKTLHSHLPLHSQLSISIHDSTTDVQIRRLHYRDHHCSSLRLPRPPSCPQPIVKHNMYIFLFQCCPTLWLLHVLSLLHVAGQKGTLLLIIFSIFCLD